MNINRMTDKELARELDRHFDVRPSQMIEVAQFIRRCVKDSVLTEEEIKNILISIMKKELCDIGEDFCFICGEPMTKEKRGLLIDHIAHALRKEMEGSND